VHWCGTRGLKARPLDIAGYGEEDETQAADAQAQAALFPLAREAEAAPSNADDATPAEIDLPLDQEDDQNGGGGERA
jgi:hypothetical protein